MKSFSIRLRLTLLYVAIFGTTLIGFASLFYSTFSANMQNEFDTALYNYAIDVAESIDVNLFGEIMIQKDPLASGKRFFPFSVRNALLQIDSADGRVVARSENPRKFSLPLTRDDITFVTQHGHMLHDASAGQLLVGGPGKNGAPTYRMLNLLVHDRGPFTFILQVAVPANPLDDQRARLLFFLFTLVPVTLGVAVVGGLFLSRRALRPVSLIIDKTRSMSPADLAQRLPVPDTDDELRQLSLTLNDLLARLERAFVSQERFIADASHELKTPLSILRGELDILRRQPRTEAEIRGFLDSAAQELEEVSRIVEDLLLLARVDAGTEALSVTRTRLDELLLEAIERLDPAAKRKDIRIRFDLEGADFETSADADLLRSLFKNLIENAIKFSPDSTMVEVRLEDAGDRLVASVRDQGPGIEPEVAKHVFERFFRGPGAQSKAPGTGLGLAIAKRIAEVHGAILELESVPGLGATFRLGIKKI